MKIENRRRVSELIKEYNSLDFALDLLHGGHSMQIGEDGSAKSVFKPTGEFRKDILEMIFKRMNNIKSELSEL